MLGGGVSGKAVAELASALNVTCRTVNDKDNANDDLDRLFSGVDLVVVSPGILPTSRLFNAALMRGLEIISELALGIRYFPGKLHIAQLKERDHSRNKQQSHNAQKANCNSLSYTFHTFQKIIRNANIAKLSINR